MTISLKKIVVSPIDHRNILKKGRIYNGFKKKIFFLNFFCKNYHYHKNFSILYIPVTIHLDHSLYQPREGCLPRGFDQRIDFTIFFKIHPMMHRGQSWAYLEWSSATWVNRTLTKMIKPFEVVCLEEDLDATRGVVMLLNKAKNWHVMYVSISQES